MPSRLTSAPAHRKTPYRAARAFFLCLLIGVCFAAFALRDQSPFHPAGSGGHILRKRDNPASVALNPEEECRLVHRADDQCAFIKKRCPTDEGGFAAYLDLYFCKLPHAKPVGFSILILWLGLLFSTIGIAASDFFCINLSTLATILGMSESMAGVTFLAFGNGSPDVFSTFAAMSTNSGSLAVGELFGAAGFITAVVAGSMALIRPFHVARKSFIRDVSFFVVAAAFSIFFLWDGKLNFWECIAMVVYYVFYVVFVVIWHWWLGRRRRRREKEAAARGHFVAPGDELDFEEERYQDDPEDAPRPAMSRGVSRDEWSALERAGEPFGGDEDEEEEARERWMSELNSNMRLTRPRARKNTMTPVRPSLVGALEFQAVLKSLQKSRNIQTFPMNTRRYSDDPTYTTAQQQDRFSNASDPAARPPYQITMHDDGTSPTMERPSLDVPKSVPSRARAVSANDAAGLRIDPDLRRPKINHNQHSQTLIDVSEGEEPSQTETNDSVGTGLLKVPGNDRELPPSPSIEISPADPAISRDRTRPAQTSPTTSSGHLAAPVRESLFRQISDHFDFASHGAHTDGSLANSPRTVPFARELPKIAVPGKDRSQPSTARSSPMVRYRDDSSPRGSRPPSLYLPAASIGSPESVPASQSAEQEVPKRPTFLSRWWPWSVLPPPGMIISSLFPTIYHWHEKTVWEKALGVVAAPSVFLLTITLPVVESGQDDDDSSSPLKDDTLNSARSKSLPPQNLTPSRNADTASSSEDVYPGMHRHSLAPASATGLATASIATQAEQRGHNYGEQASSQPNIMLDSADVFTSPQLLPVDHTSPSDSQSGPELWNRWLLIIQLFLAPLFIVLAIWSQAPTDITTTWLIKPMLISLLISLLLLIPLLLTTTPTHRPAAYRYILSLAGFVVSIAWISTIAGEVVGALKALAVILNMSHAIMGLTIFAVGNSLGDLVADVTTAKLGYPVMALSACFGGPMLNILLGIGLSGSYILMRGANKRAAEHPDKDFKFKSYNIEVGDTLIISGATLLVTLVGLLIAVPLNKWVFSKRIGWALIALWVLSTIANVVLEVTGISDHGTEDLAMGS